MYPYEVINYNEKQGGEALLDDPALRSARGSVELGLSVDCGVAGTEPDRQPQSCLCCRVKYSVHEPTQQHREQRLFSFSVGRLNHLRILSPP